MPKVMFTYKSGRQKMISSRDADLLSRLRRGTYQTRDMVSAPVQPVPIDLDKMDAQALHALAKERGVKVHHMSGAEKVRAALREAEE